jgi:hypothetical protein
MRGFAKHLLASFMQRAARAFVTHFPISSILFTSSFSFIYLFFKKTSKHFYNTTFLDIFCFFSYFLKSINTSNVSFDAHNH